MIRKIKSSLQDMKIAKIISNKNTKIRIYKQKNKILKKNLQNPYLAIFYHYKSLVKRKIKLKFDLVNPKV